MILKKESKWIDLESAEIELRSKEKHDLIQFYSTLSTTTLNLELLHNNKITSLEQANELTLRELKINILIL